MTVRAKKIKNGGPFSNVGARALKGIPGNLMSTGHKYGIRVDHRL
jgi:hypothetical protein